MPQRRKGTGEPVAAIAASASDSYKRLIQMYGIARHRAGCQGFNTKCLENRHTGIEMATTSDALRGSKIAASIYLITIS
jgi:hypothetical protein